MAEIKPFKAWRYNKEIAKNIGEYVSPLFDVISNEQREVLYQNPSNSIHLSVPRDGKPDESIVSSLNEWKNNGVIIRDDKPCIYVYYQYFNLHNDPKLYCRKGFISFIKAYDWDEKVILRHENTIPKSVQDRTKVLAATGINASSTHGLYSDKDFELEEYMDEAIKKPLYETEDYQGVRDVLAVIDNPEIIQKFVDKLSPQRVILADGHHRYEGSLAYRKIMKEENPKSTGKEPFNYHMMYLTNMELDDLRILPTHRLISGLDKIDKEEFLQKAGKYFHIKEVESPFDLFDIIIGKKWAFGVILKDFNFKLRLKEEMFETMKWPFPIEVKKIDLTVMHYFIIEKILGIKGKDQRNSDNITFERNFSKCITKVLNEEAQAAFITNEISIDQVKEVCYSGYTMPQKSTYFYPKTICGFLFGDVSEW